MYNTQLPKYESEKNLSYFGPIRDQMFPILAGQGCYNSLSGLSSLDHILKINFNIKVVIIHCLVVWIFLHILKIKFTI